MSKKIRRNDPCPCGSGKKYKNCCMSREQSQPIHSLYPSISNYALQNDEAVVSKYFQSHSTADILNFIIGLQMSPANHGKNVRIEELAKLAVLNINDATIPVSVPELASILDSDYAENHMEDLPCNLFSENVPFYGGSYTVFPGIACQAIEILKLLLHSVFQRKDKLPVELDLFIYSGVHAMLLLGGIVAERAGLSGNIRGIDYENTLFDYSYCHVDFSVSVEEFNEYLSDRGINAKIMERYILNISDPLIAFADPDHSPILKTPVVEYDGRYYFLLISNQANAINTFIQQTLIESHHEYDVVAACHKHEWDEIRSGLTSMHWPLLICDLPENTDAYVDETMAQFDVNWLAYVCFVHDTGEDLIKAVNNELMIYYIDEHIKTVLQHVKTLPVAKDKHILTLLVYSSMGGPFMVPHGGEDIEDYRISFSASDFIELSKSENWTPLSLLRFAQTLSRHKDCFTPGLDLVDIYSIYKKYGESFYLSDEHPLQRLIIPPDDGRHLIFDAKMSRNLQSIDFIFRDKQSSIPVITALEGTCIVKPATQMKDYWLAVTSYTIPIWLHCGQVSEYYSKEHEMADLFGMAIAFWLYKLTPSLSLYIDSLFSKATTIEMFFDEDVFDEVRRPDDFTNNTGTPFSFIDSEKLIIHIHRNSFALVRGGNNSGEREMMKEILTELLKIDTTVVQDALELYMPLSSAKMILMADTDGNEMLDHRWMTEPLFISNACDQMLLDDTSTLMASKGYDINGEITDEHEKKVFLGNLVSSLLSELECKVIKYNKPLLLRRLIDINEALLWDRERDGIVIPAKLLCLADNEEKRAKFLEKDHRQTDSSLAARCLTEYVVAHCDWQANEEPGRDEIEEMMALMRAIVTYGSQNDALNLGLADIAIEKLGSGRYEITDNTFQERIADFSADNNRENIWKKIIAFPKRLSVKKPVQKNDVDSAGILYSITPEDVNNAFLADWGVSFSDIDAFCYGCSCICAEHQTSALDISREEFITELLISQTALSKDKVEICISHFTLQERASYLTAPKGYKNPDVFPWVYNRELSYIRRFIMSYKLIDGSERFVLGPRSAMSSLRQLSTLLSDGRLKDETPELSKLRGWFNNIKGREFNDEVRRFLNQYENLKVWGYEVSINKGANLNADTNYGDIDVLAYDSGRKIVFSIECKDTEKARNVREMKTELDKYFGRQNTRRDGYIDKHLKRHNWLLAHTGVVKKLIGEDSDIRIVSFLMTSEVIPLTYISKVQPPLPILAFSKIQEAGLELMYTSLGIIN